MEGARDIAARAAELSAGRVPFVHATVVLAERPTSAKPGYEAIVLPNGTIEGFVGGSCAEASIVKAARVLLDEGGTKLLRVTANLSEAAPAGVEVVHNPCLSGGTMEVYLEARHPPPLVVVAGDAPIARAARLLCSPLGWEARSYGGPLPGDTSAVVVASHGRGEEQVLLEALRAGVPYVALVASRPRGRAVLDALPIAPEERARVHTPAGLDIGAATPGEVALAILAEVVASGASHRVPVARGRGPVQPVGSAKGGHAQSAGAPGLANASSSLPSSLPPLPGEAALDPVCGMAVVQAEAAPHLDHGGRVLWFCGRGCLEAFSADPAAYERR